MMTMSVILTFITLGLVGFVCWAFNNDCMEARIISLLFLISFMSITTVSYVETVKLNDLAKQQKLAESLGYTTLTNNEVYNTSKADLDKLLKLGDKYYVLRLQDNE